jgi:hypothetical protein
MAISIDFPDHIYVKLGIDLCSVCLNQTKWQHLKFYQVVRAFRSRCLKPEAIGIKIK